MDHHLDNRCTVFICTEIDHHLDRSTITAVMLSREPRSKAARVRTVAAICVATEGVAPLCRACLMHLLARLHASCDTTGTPGWAFKTLYPKPYPCCCARLMHLLARLHASCNTTGHSRVAITEQANKIFNPPLQCLPDVRLLRCDGYSRVDIPNTADQTTHASLPCPHVAPPSQATRLL